MEHFGVMNYFTYVVGTIFVILLPGPNSMYVLCLAAQQGNRRGWAAVLGILTGDGILMLLTAAGAATLLVRYPSVFLLIKLIGALYLTYLGFRLLQGVWRSWRSQGEIANSMVTLAPVSAYKAFSKALFVSLLNPKAILFFFSFFVQFIDPHYPSVMVPFVILALTLQFFSVSYMTILIFAGAKLARVFSQNRRVAHLSSTGVGVGFIGFALKLALASAS